MSVQKSKGVIFLDEDAVDVFISDSSAPVGIDDDDAEGLILSLTSIVTDSTRHHHDYDGLTKARSFLSMLKSIQDVSRRGHRASDAYPIVICTSPKRVVSWPGDQHERLTDLEYLQIFTDNLAMKDANYMEIVQNIERATRPYLTSNDVDTMILDNTDVAIANYSRIRAIKGEDVNINGFYMPTLKSSRTLLGDKDIPETFDVDAYFDDILGLTTADVYDVGSRKPKKSGPVDWYKEDERIISVDGNVYDLHDIFVNRPSPRRPVRIVSSALNTCASLVTHASWLTPKPVKLLSLTSKRIQRTNTQAILDGIRWKSNINASDWAAIVKKIVISSSQLEPISSNNNPEILVDRQHFRNDKLYSLVHDAISSIPKSTGATSSNSKNNSNSTDSEIGPCTYSNKRQTPRSVLGRYLSGVDDDVANCDHVTFTNIGGTGITLRLAREGPNSGLFEFDSISFGADSSTNTKQVVPIQNTDDLPDNHGTYLAYTFDHVYGNSKFKARHMYGVNHVEVNVKVNVNLDVNVNVNADVNQLDQLDLELSIEDAAHVYVKAQHNRIDNLVKLSNGDYEILLNQYIAVTNIILTTRERSFVLNNATFMNPLEMYKKRLAKSTSVLKSRRQQNLMKWKGSPKSYDLNEMRQIAKMRLNTMGIFCVRTLAAHAALLSIGGKKFEYVQCPESMLVEGKTYVCVIVNIVRDRLNLPCDDVALVRYYESYVTDLQNMAKTFPKSDNVSPTFTSSNIVMDKKNTFEMAPGLSILVERVRGSLNKDRKRCCMVSQDEDMFDYFGNKTREKKDTVVTGVPLPAKPDVGTVEYYTEQYLNTNYLFINEVIKVIKVQEEVLEEDIDDVAMDHDAIAYLNVMRPGLGDRLNATSLSVARSIIVSFCRTGMPTILAASKVYMSSKLPIASVPSKYLLAESIALIRKQREEVVRKLMADLDERIRFRMQNKDYLQIDVDNNVGRTRQKEANESDMMEMRGSEEMVSNDNYGYY
jgi:hypothetical protein